LHPGVVLVSTDEAQWQERLRAATGGRPVRAVLDPVGGETASEMIPLLAPGGTLVSYGDLSGRPIKAPALAFSVRDLRIHGVSVGRWASLPEPVRREDLCSALVLAKLGAKLLPVAARYDLADIAEAVAHAQRPAKQGAVLLTTH
jgi:NADPH:quinone reductase-like Zn-dependent oxidoreductase